ncbi:glycosyltransferase [Paenibacillus nasutitermitis]|uniref:Glycosyltransferase 2-like domain-containing protein n=1 Tax=Paenibacillus nasutitermitis TaxID=1652958 RepID=A0A916Z4R3_9BACL|nr:glycosyltransferase [Paenibacillus nasutitermitis]GGD76164.1 hypothetical protein GCM10010911_37740 [Paenibacillus nasutitermitis]
MLVSIVTVYYNRAEHVIESIKSLLGQSYTNIEVIAVDDGSTDDTLAVMHTLKDPRLKIISHSNRGFVKSIIEAVAQSSGEIIAVHGSGDISYETRIESQLHVLLTQPQVGVVGCYVENVNTVTNVSFIGKPAINDSIGITHQLLQGNIFTHGEVMYRRSVYEQSGGYRDFFKFTQDYDLWLRMSLITQFHVVPEVLYRRYTLPDGVSASIDKTLMQKYFGEMGKQCVELRMKHKPDLIDSYGMYGSFFRERSGRLSKILWRLSLIALYQGDSISAMKINKKSLEEKRTLYNLGLQTILVSMNRSKWIKRLVVKSLTVVKTRKNRKAADSKKEPQKQIA